MNRYPLWKYIVIVAAIIFGIIYTLPNFFGESPAVQISSVRSTVKVDTQMMDRVERILRDSQIPVDGIYFDASGMHSTIKVRFTSTDIQFKAKEVLESKLNTDPQDPTFSIAFNLLPNTPQWLQSLHALPMYLGLDLRGGVHFLMQVDVDAAINSRIQGLQISARNLLRENGIRYSGLVRVRDTVELQFNDPQTRQRAEKILTGQLSEITLREEAEGNKLIIALSADAIKQIRENSVKQNIATLSKRVNELGVNEPVIQQQGADRIVVQLPGVQDVSRAKDIIGRTATLEVRMVDESITRGTEESVAVPLGSEIFRQGKGAPVILYKEPVLTGEYISNASASFDQYQQPAVSIDLNGDGGRKMRQATRGKIGKLMAIVLFEKGKGEVLTVASIRDELGSKFQITGMDTPEAATDLALLLRAGSLAAPMQIIEERTIGPQLGAENITKGFLSTLYGFVAVSLFMIVYYMVFGFFSVIALSVNVLLLIAILSLMQITLTLPGIAAIALALGMAIDSNVLINERIREELRANNSPQTAIANGFGHAWATILDSNVTTLIAGVALLVFGTGPIRGFAVVHVLGILTSLFSSVFVSRGLANLWYGRRKKLTSLSIGQIWRPDNTATNDKK
ncbi:protein translocase subunit SecD [Oxalobacter sp. OxGP1]|uniref:protein translocase subunit SecD n=1 Tax=Oxalobacter paeniformigenes TaxID=2946594 RepID=UPI0022AFAACF|nr:protein translocase subunit SecD [Oxalobacter paeniformigenes]MCZ4053554.1 protein translocase subunit SecD [Oxalobacter paeniformigenes]